MAILRSVGQHLLVEIDGDYNNQVPNPYTANAGAGQHLNIGVIAWSLARINWGAQGTADKNAGMQRRRDFVAVIFASSCCSVRCPQRTLACDAAKMR